METRITPFVLEILHEVHGISIRLLDPQGCPTFSLLREQSPNPLGPAPDELLRQAMKRNHWGRSPVAVQTPSQEQFLVMAIPVPEGGSLMLGPVLGTDISMEVVDRILSDSGSPIRHKPALIRHFREVPRLEFRAFCKLGILLWFLTHGEELDFMDLLENGSDSLTETLRREVRLGTERAVVVNRQRQFFHHSPVIEQNITECIRLGDRARLMNVLRDMPMDGSPGILSKGDPLRSLKNNMICMVALATRAAIAGGLHYEEAFTFSDQIIQHMEELQTQEDVLTLSMSMYGELADRVRDAASGHYSAPVEKCRAYLFRNLYMDVSLEDLTRLSGMGRNQLTSRFKTETGLTPHQWILSERVREAQRLLRSTENSVTDISIALNFHDVSHFTKTFRKVAGISPLTYRKSRPDGE